jgi:hypothetical protein
MVHVRRIALVLLVSSISHVLFAVKFEWGGFARLDNAFDTRECVGSDDGATVLYPLPVEYDSNCSDINAQAHYTLTPSLTRLCVRFGECKINKCDVKGYIESDFTGALNADASSSYTVGLLKVRQAYVKAMWPKTTLLLGETYHPVAVPDCAPNTVGFYGGIPITSYAYNPQIRFERFFHELMFGVTLYSQFLFFSPGPLGWSRSYIRHSLMPEVCLVLAWKHHDMTTGLLFDVKRIQPAFYTSPITDATKKYVTEERLTSMMGSAWLGFTINNFRINNQVIVSQNGPDFNTISGYAVSTYNTVTGACTYTNTASIGVWTDLDYQGYDLLKPGMYLGYVQSIGANKNVYLDPTTGKPTYYGFNEKLDAVLRFAPRVTTSFNNFFIGFEVDYSRAWFGPMNSCGKHPYTSPVESLRLLLVTKYIF